jgi:hypothetical protein
VVRHSSVLGDPANNSSAATVVVLVFTLSSFCRTLFHMASLEAEAEASPLGAVKVVAMVLVRDYVLIVQSFIVSIESHNANPIHPGSKVDSFPLVLGAGLISA